MHSPRSKRPLEDISDSNTNNTPPPSTSTTSPSLSTSRKRRRIKPVPLKCVRRPERSMTRKLLNRQVGQRTINNVKMIERRRISDVSKFNTSFVWRGESPVFTSKFANVSNALAWADEDGYLCIRRSKTAAQVEIEAHANAIFDLVWSADDRRIFTGSGDQTCSMFDPETGSRLKTVTSFFIISLTSKQ